MKPLFLLIFFSIIVGTSYGKHKQKVIYTLQPGEYISYGEYNLQKSYSGKKGYSLLIEGNDTTKVISNGKSEGPWQAEKDKYSKFYSFSKQGLEPNVYKKQSKQWYTTIGEKEYGPFDRLSSYDIKLHSDKRFAFIYKMGDSSYINLEGTILGPLKYIYPLYYRPTGDFMFKYTDFAGNSFVKTNETTYGPYSRIEDLNQRSNGDYVFYYKDFNDRCFVKTNKTTYGPYRRVKNLHQLSTSDFTFEFQRGKEYFANINGKEYGPYSYLLSVQTFEDKGFAIYYKAKTSSKAPYCVNINNKIYGPYIYTDNFKAWSAQNFAFQFRTQTGEYVNINGEELGPYQHIDDFKRASTGDYMFTYSGNFKYAKSNGKDFGPYDRIEHKYTNAHTLPYINFQKDGRWFRNSCGKIDQLDSKIYKTDQNMSRYIKGKPDVTHDRISTLTYYPVTESEAYTYEDNDTSWVYVNGKILGPYDWAGNLKYLSNGKYAYSYRSFDGEKYVRVMGEKYGPYDDIEYYGFTLLPDEKFAFVFTKNKEQFVKVNDREYGPYIIVRSLDYHSNGYFSYSYWGVDKTGGEIINGQKTDKYTQLNNRDNLGENHVSKICYSANRKYLLEYSSEYDYVLINGKKISNSPGFHASFSEKESRFYWLSIQGKDIVLNSYAAK